MKNSENFEPFFLWLSSYFFFFPTLLFHILSYFWTVQAFVVICIVVPLLLLVVAALLTKAMEAVSLGWLNRWLGAGLGALKFLLLVSLLICVVEFIDSDNTMIDRTMKEESSTLLSYRVVRGNVFPLKRSYRTIYTNS